MKDLILFSKENIVKHIVNLIAKKHLLDIEIFDKLKDDIPKSKAILIDEEDFFSNILSNFSDNIVLITNQKIKTIDKYALVIKKPFLPIKFEKDIIKFLDDIKINDKNEILEENSDDLIDFIDNLEDNSTDKHSYKTDETTISQDDIANNGGVLDTNELNNLKTIIDDEIDTNEKNNNQDIKDIETKVETNLDTLTSIIDNAIEELSKEDEKIYDKYTLVLNKFSFDEIKPLLTKLDQNLIDELADKKELNLTLKVEK